MEIYFQTVSHCILAFIFRNGKLRNGTTPVFPRTGASGTRCTLRLADRRRSVSFSVVKSNRSQLNFPENFYQPPTIPGRILESSSRTTISQRSNEKSVLS